MVKQIPIGKGKFTQVDDDDYEELSKYKWYSDTFFDRVQRTIYKEDGKQTSLRMHRVIALKHGIIDESQAVDHIDRNPYNNTKANLRAATQQENCFNKGIGRNKTSKYKGVRLHRNSWQARIDFNKKEMSIGFFANEEDAARAYDKKAIEYFGEFACTNKKMGLLK